MICQNIPFTLRKTRYCYCRVLLIQGLCLFNPWWKKSFAKRTSCTSFTLICSVYSANHPLFSSLIPRLTNLVSLTKIISAYGLLHSYQSWSQISFIFMSVLLYLLLPSFLCVVAKSLPCFCLSQCTRAVETSTFIVHKTPFSSKSTALKLRPTSVRPSHPTAVEDIMPIRVGASSH